MHRNPRRALHTIPQPWQAAARITGKVPGLLAYQRTGLFGARVGLSNRWPSRPPCGVRFWGRGLGAMAFGYRLTGSLGLARRNDAAVRTNYFSVVPAVGDAFSVQSTHAA